MFHGMKGRRGGMGDRGFGFGMGRNDTPMMGDGFEGRGGWPGRGEGARGEDARGGGARGGGRGGRMHHGEGYDAWRMGGGPRARGPRMFDRGELRLVLLKLIADEPRHGYDLIRAIEDLTGGAYVPSPGVVYPTLTLLDEMGLIEEQAADGAKKRFAVSDAGSAHIAENRATIDALIARLAAVGEHRQRTDHTPVRRAMSNLGTVLRHRLGAGEVPTETLHQIVALIDEAAQKIERMA